MIQTTFAGGICPWVISTQRKEGNPRTEWIKNGPGKTDQLAIEFIRSNPGSGVAEICKALRKSSSQINLITKRLFIRGKVRCKQIPSTRAYVYWVTK